MEHINISKSGSPNGWQANVGEAALNMLDNKGIYGEIRDKILDQSVDILESCGNPNQYSNDLTGLVIGYVQSGKTLSFTTLSALAAQNGFNVIIVIAGTTTSLVDQTHERLAVDLEINSSSIVSWKTYKNPTSEDRNEVKADLVPGILNRNPVLLITVMKNATHLNNLCSLFYREIDTATCKVLIIDDEADQASLNTKASKKEEEDASTIYKLIRSLKKTFVNHTYVQYTATPQAPLFISLLDILSPSFVKILTPGDDYTGGKAFFKRNQQSNYPHVFDIPEEEIYTKDQTFRKIPSSLVEATIFYFLTVVIGALRNETPQKNNRTMMVHPSHLTEIHSIYEKWLQKLKKRWLQEFELGDSDPDKIKLVNDFKGVYDEIPSNSELPSFSEIIKYLPEVINSTPIFLSNSSVKNKVDFKRHYSMILVGGQILDRGFTVEGLNVTYMPRSIGIGNADTLQQRCRFFGYKRKYLDFCRIYLPRISKRAYIDYVTHEEDLRTKLDLLDKESKPLKEFKRMFVLSRDLNITRKNIISDDLQRYRLKGWRPLDYIDDNVKVNNETIVKFCQSIAFVEIAPSSPEAKPIQIHEEAYLPAEEVIENLLLSLHYHDPSNSLLINHLLSLLGLLLDESEDLHIHVVNISKGLTRDRSINEKGKIKNLFQGANPKTDYKGDRFVKSEDVFTIQIHNIIIKDSGENFKTIAIHFPESLAQNIITLNSI